MLRSIIMACAAGAWCCAQEPHSNPVRDQYNRTYASPDEQQTFNHEPNAFLTTVLRDTKPGKAVDVGMGQGRDAIWLARRGWHVTGFDLSDVGVKLDEGTGRSCRRANRCLSRLHGRIRFRCRSLGSDRTHLRSIQPISRQAHSGAPTGRASSLSKPFTTTRAVYGSWATGSTTMNSSKPSRDYASSTTRTHGRSRIGECGPTVRTASFAFSRRSLPNPSRTAS